MFYNMFVFLETRGKPPPPLISLRLHDMFVYQSGPRRVRPRYVSMATPETPICFTICLFISPDLDGYRAPKNAEENDDGEARRQ
jgi:hypothetical protein